MTDEELRALQERVHLLGELQMHPGWEILRDFVALGVGPKQRQLLNGGAKSHEAYLELVGFVKGATFVVEAQKTLGDNLERELQRRRVLEQAERGSE